MKRTLIGAVCGWLAVVAIGWIDYLTGTEFGLSLFYALPIFLVARFSGSRAGTVLAATAVACWFLVLVPEHPYRHDYAIYWNAMVRAGFFALVVGFAKTQHELTRQRDAATKDFLTGIANRRGFEEFARREIERGRREGGSMTLAYIDCDDFKSVNDTFGHSVGNDLLAKVGTVLKANVRAVDLCARVGGDEFVVLLCGMTHTRVPEILERIQMGLLTAMTLENWHVTFSIGAVTLDASVASFEGMMGRADELMYRAKRRGKARTEHQTLHGPVDAACSH